MNTLPAHPIDCRRPALQPRPPPDEPALEAAVQAEYAVENPPANKRVRRLSALVVVSVLSFRCLFKRAHFFAQSIALAIRHKLRSLN